MHLEKVLRYPAPASDVARLLADRAFVEEVCAASDAISWEVEVQGVADGAFTVTSTRVLPSHELPDAARRIIGASIRVREVDRWEAPGPDGARTGTLVLEVAGAPVTARAAMALTPLEGGSRTEQVLDGDLSATVPLIGARIERAAAGPLLQALDQLEDLARQRLTGAPG